MNYQRFTQNVNLDSVLELVSIRKEISCDALSAVAAGADNSSDNMPNFNMALNDFLNRMPKDFAQIIYNQLKIRLDRWEAENLAEEVRIKELKDFEELIKQNFRINF